MARPASRARWGGGPIVRRPATALAWRRDVGEELWSGPCPNDSTVPMTGDPPRVAHEASR